MSNKYLAGGLFVLAGAVAGWEFFQEGRISTLETQQNLNTQAISDLKADVGSNTDRIEVIENCIDCNKPHPTVLPCDNSGTTTSGKEQQAPPKPIREYQDTWTLDGQVLGTVTEIDHDLSERGRSVLYADDVQSDVLSKLEPGRYTVSGDDFDSFTIDVGPNGQIPGDLENILNRRGGSFVDGDSETINLTRVPEAVEVPTGIEPNEILSEDFNNGDIGEKKGYIVPTTVENPTRQSLFVEGEEDGQMYRERINDDPNDTNQGTPVITLADDGEGPRTGSPETEARKYFRSQYEREGNGWSVKDGEDKSVSTTMYNNNATWTNEALVTENTSRSTADYGTFFELITDEGNSYDAGQEAVTALQAGFTPEQIATDYAEVGKDEAIAQAKQYADSIRLTNPQEAARIDDRIEEIEERIGGRATTSLEEKLQADIEFTAGTIENAIEYNPNTDGPKNGNDYTAKVTESEKANIDDRIENLTRNSYESTLDYLGVTEEQLERTVIDNRTGATIKDGRADYNRDGERIE